MFLLFLSLLISFLNAFISSISSVAQHLIKRSSRSDDIKSEIADLKKQLSQVSMVEEFPKYARLERKINELNEQLKQDLRDHVFRRLKFTAAIKYSLQAAVVLTSLVIFWIYRWTPIIVVPPEWLGPFSTAISWPTGQPGAIGFPVWYLACNSFAKFVAKPSVQ